MSDFRYTASQSQRKPSSTSQQARDTHGDHDCLNTSTSHQHMNNAGIKLNITHHSQVVKQRVSARQ